MKYLLLFLIPLTIRAQEFIEITFKIQANNIPDSAKVYISGNNKELGNWQPDKVSLINTSGNYWEKSFSLPAGENIEYKFTRGSWNSEAVKENGDIPENSKLLIKNDTTIVLEINYWKDQFEYKLKGQVTGRVDYYSNVKGEGIPPRDVMVWLPPGYEININDRYPVVYMQDGQNLFDPSTSAFGVDWQIDETADSLIRKGYMNPIIIVGLANTDWRSSEYSYNDTGYAYMKFVAGRVKPFIDSAYRTMTDPGNTAVGGSSLGGLISFMIAWNYPDVFSMALCISPALKVYNIDYVKYVNEYKGTHKQLKFYFDAGINSLDSLLIPGTQQMIGALEKQGYIEGRDILWYPDKDGAHSEASWAKRIWRPLLFFFGKHK